MNLELQRKIDGIKVKPRDRYPDTGESAEAYDAEDKTLEITHAFKNVLKHINHRAYLVRQTDTEAELLCQDHGDHPVHIVTIRNASLIL